MVRRDSPARRREILAATLKVMRNAGPARASTAKIAGEANCSKETLYNWFGDREGLMAALAEEQSRAMIGALEAALSARASARENLVRFCAALLDLLTGEASVLIHRVAISQMGESEQLARSLAAGSRAETVSLGVSLLERARAERLLGFDDADEAFASLYGLAVAEKQIGAILGVVDARPSGEAMHVMAERAVRRLEAAYPAPG